MGIVYFCLTLMLQRNNGMLSFMIKVLENELLLRYKYIINILMNHRPVHRQKGSEQEVISRLFIMIYLFVLDDSLTS